MAYTAQQLKESIERLYGDIDACITDLIRARLNRDAEGEGKALFKMEGLMVATEQELTCIGDYLEETDGKALLYAINKTEERTRKDVVNKACEWLRKYLPMMYEGTKEIDEDFIYIFRKAMDAVAEDSSTPELNWQDILKIVEIYEDLDTLSWLDDEPMFGSNQEFFEEVLRRFKEERK